MVAGLHGHHGAHAHKHAMVEIKRGIETARTPLLSDLAACVLAVPKKHPYATGGRVRVSDTLSFLLKMSITHTASSPS